MHARGTHGAPPSLGTNSKRGGGRRPCAPGSRSAARLLWMSVAGPPLRLAASSLGTSWRHILRVSVRPSCRPRRHPCLLRVRTFGASIPLPLVPRPSVERVAFERDRRRREGVEAGHTPFDDDGADAESSSPDRPDSQDSEAPSRERIHAPCACTAFARAHTQTHTLLK